MSLALREVRKLYGNALILHGVSLEAEFGQVVAIVGANGAGKSTLIKILAGAVPKDSGSLELNGRPLDLKGPRDAIRQGICTVYQELSLVPELSVAENLLMGVLPRRRGLIDWRAARARAREILTSIGFDAIDPAAKTRDLPIAKQQMVEIARSLVSKPRILVLDEPSAVLSGSDLDSLYALIGKLRDEGTLVLYVSHRLQEVLNLADRIIVMKDGRFVAELDPKKATENDMITLMAGRKIEAIYPDRRKVFGASTLAVEGLNRVGEFEDVSFQLRAGEILSIFGLVGSGRSELVETIFGARRPDGGSISIGSVTKRFRAPAGAIKAGLALVTEDRQRTGLVLGLKVGENINLATMHGLLLSMAKRRSNAEQMINELSIKPKQSRNMEAKQLSGGNQQKAVIAKWLLTNPSILILDEPTRGVDMATRVDIYQKIDELASAGISILMVSSDLTEAVSMADRVLVMRNGRMLKELDAAKTSEDEVLAYAIGGKA
ncbi:MAG: sugar ABC transporter ATP-binding protein [Treponema sp.]|jgi:ABC-type sugar transport system ATPase subunit|nr:sugar ABC transporter ATP-binding protein [Treponema sp.]